MRLMKKIYQSIGTTSKIAGTTGAFSLAYVAADTLTLGSVTGLVSAAALVSLWSDSKASDVEAEKEIEFRDTVLSELKKINSLIQYMIVIVLSISAANILKSAADLVTYKIYFIITCAAISFILFYPWEKRPKKYDH